jgi:hypothetical protein
MIVFIWLIIFVIGLNVTSWRIGVVPVLGVAALLTLLCLFTSNNPAFTNIERGLTFSPVSLAENYIIRSMTLLAIYSAGFVVSRLVRWDRQRRGVAKAGTSPH